MLNKTSFEAEHKALAYLFAGLITITCFPVLAWHYIGTLSGLAVLAVGGLLATDLILWYSAHWAVKARSGAMRAIALITKFFISAVAVAVAATVIVIMRSDRQVESIARLQSETRQKEIAARASAAAQLAGVEGGRAAAREAMKMGEGESVEKIAGNARSQIEAYLPGWYLNVGIYCLPPLCALLGYAVLAVAGTILRRREMEAEASTSVSLPAGASASKIEEAPKPRIAWRGGQRVDSVGATLGN